MEIDKLKKKLLKIEEQLEKVRGCSVLTHGWQTQKYAKASRNWDELSKEKFELQKKINDMEINKNNTVKCNEVCELCGGLVDEKDNFTEEEHCENCGWN